MGNNVQKQSKLPTPDAVKAALGEPLQKSYIVMRDILESRAAVEDVQTVDPVAYRSTIDPMPTDLMMLLLTLQEYVQARDLHSLHQGLKELHIDSTDSSQNDLWQLLQQELSVLPTPDVVQQHCGQQAAVAYSVALDRLDSDSAADAMEDGLNKQWVAKSACRAALLVGLWADAADDKVKAVTEYNAFRDTSMERRRKTLGSHVSCECLRYGVFRLNTSSDLAQWKQHGSQYADDQNLWERLLLPEACVRHLPAKRLAAVSETDFRSNWDRLRRLLQYIQKMDVTPRVGYPCLDRPTAFFPYTNKDLRDITGVQRRSRAEYCDYVKDHLDSLTFPYAAAVADFSSIGAVQRLRGDTAVEDQPCPPKAVPAVSEYPFPARDRDRLAYLYQLCVKGSNPSDVDRLWTQLSPDMIQQMNATKDPREGCRWLKLALVHTDYAGMTPMEKYRDILRQTGNLDGAEARFDSLTQDQLLALINTATRDEGLQWLHNFDHPQLYKDMSPQEKWSLLLKAGVETAVTQSDITQGYKQLTVAAIMDLESTHTLDEGMQWLSALPQRWSASPRQSSWSPRSPPKTTRRSKVRRKLVPQYSEAGWTYAGEPVTQQQLRQMGYSQRRLRSLRGR